MDCGSYAVETAGVIVGCGITAVAILFGAYGGDAGIGFETVGNRLA